MHTTSPNNTFIAFPMSFVYNGTIFKKVLNNSMYANVHQNDKRVVLKTCIKIFIAENENINAGELKIKTLVKSTVQEE